MRWIKRHEKAIDKWIESNRPYHGPTDWDGMPDDLRDTLMKINYYESLWSDAQRYFYDQVYKDSRAHPRDYW